MMIEKERRQFPRARKVGSIDSASLAAGEREFFILLTKAESGKRKAESGKRKAESGKRKAESKNPRIHYEK